MRKSPKCGGAFRAGERVKKVTTLRYIYLVIYIVNT